MASSSASVGSPLSDQAAYDVFLSFRGEDTRYSFTDHLFQALVRAGLRTFRDNDEIDRGQELKPEIERAIIQSRGSIIILSENYANSRWCLDELVLILDQRRKFNHFVLPLFYHVSPSDVRNQRGSCTIEGSKWTAADVNRWKEALTQVADLTGMVVSGYETDIIAKVVDTIDCKLDLKLVSTPAHLTGMETRALIINSWLENEHRDANLLAIYGMGGCGKTTMAQYIYNSNKRNFESSSFVEDIGKHYKQPDGLISLQKQLLRDVLGEKNIMISSVSEGTCRIEKALQMKRVFIVLDDIDEDDVLAPLLGKKMFHSQSKILITTRLLDVNGCIQSKFLVCQVYKLKLMNDDESLELFSLHAFGSKLPKEGFKDLAIKLAHYCGGNPLALKVLGSSLRKTDNIESWTSRLSSLSSLKGDIDRKIQGVLRRSFDSLPYNNDKELFLHIACFFVGEDMDYVVTILEHDLNAKNGIVTLINKSLLTVSKSNQLMMHPLLQNMGRKIVREESKDPAEHSRVWCSGEAYNLLSEGDSLKLRTRSLLKMKNLKLLQLRYVELVGSYENFPKLRWLRWHWCLLKTIPSGLFMSSLVAIDMSNGALEKFEPPAVLKSLKFLNLDGCDKLVSICSFHQLPKLETLVLWDCSNLTALCKTIGDLKSLTLLNLTGCKKLLKASLNKKYVNQGRVKALCICGGITEKPLSFLPHSLKSLLLGHCELDYKSDAFLAFHAQSLYSLNLEGNPFELLPTNIDLKLLRILNLTSCPNLKTIICPSMLEELYTHWCTSLEKITFESARFRIRKFGYEGCFKLSEIEGFFKLVPIAELDEADLGHMKWIKAYEHYKIDLVGNEITIGRNWHIQMLYEYGIRSTYLQGIKDQIMMTSEYTSLSPFLSFNVPLCPGKSRIQGLNVTFTYKGSSCEDEHPWVLFVKVSNTTKGLTWIYNPVVYCKPKVDEDVVWVSYWPIGNILDAGDEIHLKMVLEESLVVSVCGASLVYTNGGELSQEENLEDKAKGEEVIGGDLSEFEVTTGGYYLCRRDFFESDTSYVLKMLFNDTIHYPESQGWRKSHQSVVFSGVYLDVKPLNNMHRRKIELGVSFNSASEIDKIEQEVYCLAGVEHVFLHKEIGRLIVIGDDIDPIEVATCIREFEKMVVILLVSYV